MINNVVIGKEATAGMLKGIKTATDVIRLSYGPKGMNVAVEHTDYPYHQVANDAQTIIQAVHVTDPVEKRGLAFLKELSDKANKDSGDGRKTTCILAQEIIERGYKSNMSGVELKKELDALIPLIEKHLDENKTSITKDGVYDVARIASESEKIGRAISDIYTKIGKDGVVIPEASGTYETSHNIIEGVRFLDTGYLSPYMAHDDEAQKEGRKETKAVYESPTILVTKKKIEKDSDIAPLIETLLARGKKDLVIFTDDMDSGVAARMVATHQAKVINILIIKAPTMWKNYVFEDFAKVVGATIVEDASGINYKNLELKHLGTCDKITVDKDETIILGGKDVSEHIAELKAEGSNDSLLRISWLTTKTAILKLGANSESELSYIRLKTEDAINASRLALKDGIVCGGGLALFRASQSLPDTIAGHILADVLKVPHQQIMLNSGYVIDGDGLPEGKIEDSVVDACAVVKNAVRNAIALASTILTVGAVVSIPPKTQEELTMMQLQAKRPF